MEQAVYMSKGERRGELDDEITGKAVDCSFHRKYSKVIRKC
jgi:hypothetical protein